VGQGVAAYGSPSHNDEKGSWQNPLPLFSFPPETTTLVDTLCLNLDAMAVKKGF
jgi:hypothetical protein